MKTWGVTLPITGKAYLEVEAETEEEAINAAMMQAKIKHVEEWEPLSRVNQGNVCYAMQPWTAEAEAIED